MKSICIKTNNPDYLSYLLNELDHIEIDNICISSNKFKNYKNIIIHFSGNDNKKFISELSSILACLIVDICEENFFKKIIDRDYFYFDCEEKKYILEICFDIIADDFNKYFDKKYNILVAYFNDYLSKNKSIILTGFINFRIKDYFLVLQDIVEEAVNSFVIEKEYLEFISLLKIYINSQYSSCKMVHLIYKNETSYLLDSNKNIIDMSNEIFKTKYLSDITFSSNDYALNALLSLIPDKINIHLINNNIDEFINTICLIFEERVNICTDCNICKLYKTNIKENFIKR